MKTWISILVRERFPSSSNINHRCKVWCQKMGGDCCSYSTFICVNIIIITSFRDLVFIQDCTGSQGSYISSATKNIEEICAHIFESGKLQSHEDLRVGLVAFRDHPPQDHTYITKNFGFSSDISKVHKDLSGLYASGGGDGPEAITAAMAEALNMEWREYASKMVVLIADAPPHGIGEYGDGEIIFPATFAINSAVLLQDLMKDRLTAMTHCSWHERWQVEE
jgi:hypothetical protein